jgi:hypothetical protein
MEDDPMNNNPRSVSTNSSAVRIERLTDAHLDALAMLEEYYEAVQVVQRDKPEAIPAIVNQPASGLWLAYLEDEVVGRVALRRMASISLASECKWLCEASCTRQRYR